MPIWGKRNDVLRVNRMVPGVKRFAVFCDESGTGGARFYGFGALWMADQRRGDFARDIAAMRNRFPYPDSEAKWNKVKKPNVELYKALMDYFFETHWLNFHCIVVEKAWVKRDMHKGDFDLARRKHFTQFLANKMRACIKAHADREVEFKVYVDPIASRYQKAHEAVEIIANNLVSREMEGQRPVRFVKEVDSKNRPGVQLCDVLLGALMDNWNQGSSNQYKADLKAHIADYLGWPDLNSDTWPAERKFNVWYLCDPRCRPIEKPRPVRLKIPLPPRKVYRRR